MRTRTLLLGGFLLLHGPTLFGIGGAPAARAGLIDAWLTPQHLATPPHAVAQTVSGPDVLGGYRGSSLLAIGSDASSLTIGGGTLTFAVDPAAAHNVFLTVIWDGPPPGTGLGGADLTDGGRATAFVLPVLEVTGATARYALVVADTSPRVGNVLGVLPDGTHDLALVLPFSLFISQFDPVHIDMARVARVELQLEVAPGGSVVLGPLQVPVVPEPAGLSLLAATLVAAALSRRTPGAS